MLTRIIYWFNTHTMNPIAWPYVFWKTVWYHFIAPKTPYESSITIGEDCPHMNLTEVGLCEDCGKPLYGP